MMKIKKIIRIEDSYIWKTFLLCFLLGIATFLPYIIIDGGIFTLCDDYNTQMIPFAVALNNNLKAGTGSWQWNIGLGAQRLGGNSYYYLGSPLFWLSMLFPGKWFPYIVGPFYILKYALAGMFAYMYLRKYVNNKLCAVIGACLYAFSGFQSINLEFYMFHDVVAFFPLLMIGIEELYEKDRKHLFIFAVALNCMLNYFFFFGEVVFLLIYVLFRYPKELGKDKFIKQSWWCILCGIIGMGVVSSIFIPTAIYTFGNPRVLPDIVKMWHKRLDLGSVLKGFLMPAEAMNNYSIVRETNWNSVCCYIPFVGMSLSISYMIKNRKSWLTKLLIFCIVISFIPVAVATFYIWTNPYYRWWYMFILMMLVAAVQVLDNISEYRLKIVTYIFEIVSLAYIAAYWVGNYKGDYRFIVYRPKIFLLLSAIMVLSAFCTILMTYQKKWVIQKYLVLTMFFCVLTTSVTITLYRKMTHEENYKAYFAAGLSLEKCEDEYRYAETDNILMYPGGANGTGTFNSTISNSVRDFEEVFDYVSISTNLHSDWYEGLTEFLAGKYVITRDEPCYESYTIVEREACPIGFYYDKYMLWDELLEIDLEKRGYGFLRDLIIREKDLHKIEDVMEHDDDYLLAPDTTIHEYVEISQDHKVDNFKRIHSGYQCTTNSDDTHVYFFSVPYDYGWHAYIDGEKTEVIYAGAFTAVVVPEGAHTVTFKFRSFGLILGTIFCVIATIGWGSLIYCDYKKRKDTDNNSEVAHEL